MADVEKRRVSSDPVDYASFILYVKRGVPACERLARLAAPRQDVIVQDVERLRERPSWLRGVPTLVALPDYVVHTGTAAVQALEAFLARDIGGVSGAAAGAAGAARAAPLDGDEPGGGFGGLFCIEEDDRYQEKPSSRSEGLSLEEMLRRRGAQAAPPP